jgi:alkylation response protein AidB-like acyl-CoA dehydrogenase
MHPSHKLYSKACASKKVLTFKGVSYLMTYAPPLGDLRFALWHTSGLGDVLKLPKYQHLTPDLIDAVLEEAGKLAAEVITPTNHFGDKNPPKLVDGKVALPAAIKEAYQKFQQGGWCSVPFEEEHGGQGLPWVIAAALQEIWASANMGFSLCPLLTQGAVESLARYGTDEQKNLYLSKLVSGEWTGTMNLTEPQAGSDVGAVRMKAEPAGDHYLLSGQKIYITYGEHDLTDNIIHMVLARTPDAPPGSKGLSFFIVPKFLVNTDGSLGERNDVHAVSLEHKLGIHASPTAVLAYGDNGKCIGYRVGAEGQGMEIMFVMMNCARLGVGLQGVAMAERSYQAARDYAIGRIQSRDVRAPKAEPVAIINHPDVRRMLLTQRAYAEAGRALALKAFAAVDLGRAGNTAAAARADLLTPIVKAWCTDAGVEAASIGVQVHGGMGYIEETGAAQYYRDAKIACIYEGTNGIQANDLVFRKLARDEGAAVLALISEGRTLADTLTGRDDDGDLIAHQLDTGVEALHRATLFLLLIIKSKPDTAAASAYSYLRLLGLVAGGMVMAQSALVALKLQSVGKGDPDFITSKILTARFYACQIMPHSTALAQMVGSSGASMLRFENNWF